MRWIRLLSVLVRARLRSRINVVDTAIVRFRVWLTDVDVSVMNHATMLTVMEAGRVDFMVRTGFLEIATRNKWYFPIQALSVQYYRPLRLFETAAVYTRLSYVDDRWIYLEQKIMRKGKGIAFCLVKVTVKIGRQTVPTSEVVSAMKIEKLPNEKYDLIKINETENAEMNARLVDD